MERARHRRSKSVSGIEGTRQVQKQKAISRISTDARSYIDRSNWDDMLRLELERRSSGQVTGIPMKKLLAEEMSKKIESKRQSPSIIARLMGLEVMPPACHSRRQNKMSSDSHWKAGPVNCQQNSQLHDGRLSRRSSTDQQEFRDVYEDLEALHVVKSRCSSRWRAGSVRTKPEVAALLRQEFMDARYLSTDENLQHSTELNDTLEMPDSLLGNPLPDLKVGSGSSVGSHIAVLKPVNSAINGSKAKAWRQQGDTLKKYHHVISHMKREDDLLLESHNCHGAHISCDLSRFQLDEKNDQTEFPTKVVLLKPNLGKMSASSSSANTSHGYHLSCKENKEFPGVQGAEKLPQTWKNSHGVGFSVPISTKARGIAREITMKMRNSCDATWNIDTCSVSFKGYAGDESSYDATDSDSERESEVFKLSSMESFNDSSLCRYTSSLRGESSVNKEAKMRLSERWKMTHKFQDLEISQGNTLGEMLAIPERETRPHHLNAKMSFGWPGDRLGNNNGSVTWDPLGISTSDGWKDENLRNLSRSRSRSLPPSRVGKSPGRSPYRDELTEDKPMIHGGPVHHGRSKAVNGHVSHKEYNSPKDSKSRSKKHHSDQHMFINETNSSSEANYKIQTEANLKDLTEQQSIFQVATDEDMLKIPVSDVMMIAESESPSLPSISPELNSKALSSIVDGERSSPDDIEDSMLQELPKGTPDQGGSPFIQCFGTEPDPSDSSKEADHNSPVSVLEDPFTEEASLPYDSFERVSAELHGLRMQLQLLKMESGECTNLPTLTLNEEQMAQPSAVASEGNLAPGDEGWEVSYTFDVLTSSGLQDSDFNMFRRTWYSPDCPLDPELFDTLEHIYKNDTGETRSERKLLFDRINLALLEIFDKQTEYLCPWTMPNLGMGLKGKEGVGDVLKKLMKLDFGEGEISSDGVVLQWTESKGEIEVIGNEIEKLLIDDILTELVGS